MANKKFLWRMLVMTLGIFEVFLTSCVTKEYSEKMYADVIGFNDGVYESYMLPPRNPKNADAEKPIPEITPYEGKPYNLLDTLQTQDMKYAIAQVPSGQNTTALYALDVGLDRVALINKKFMEGDPSSRYYVVFFTDGIDNASVDMAIRNKRGTYPRGIAGRDAYAAAMHSRMEQILKEYSFLGLIKKPNSTNSFQSYVLLFKGEDLASYDDKQLEGMLAPFRASQNAGDPPELIQDSDMDNLRRKFEDAFIIPRFSFQVPKDYVGQRVRMQLESEDGDEVYFEATLTHQEKTNFLFFKEDFYTLEDIKVSNFEFIFDEYTKQKIIEMDKIAYKADSNTVPFSINNLKFGGKSYRMIRDEVKQYHDDGTGDAKFENTEYRKNSDSKKNAYILLIMDTSFSLGEHAAEARETAVWIVDFINKQQM
ncbi:MAG: hypothetical protein LBI40_00045 [Treponema sp.]|jgi:hypothetical protein|nr:hypothetical protein [Treponema sp.]